MGFSVRRAVSSRGRCSGVSHPSQILLRKAGHSNYVIHQAPHSPYSSHLTFSNYSILFLDFIQAPSCLLSCRSKQVSWCWWSLSIWSNVSKQTYADTWNPFTELCCVKQAGLSTERLNKYEVGAHLRCSNVRPAYTISSQRASTFLQRYDSDGTNRLISSQSMLGNPPDSGLDAL